MPKLQHPLSVFEVLRHSLLLLVRNPKYSALLCVTILMPLLLQRLYWSLCFPDVCQIIGEIYARESVDISLNFLFLTLAYLVSMLLFWIFITPLQISIFGILYLSPAESKLSIKQAFTVSPKVSKNLLTLLILVTFEYLLLILFSLVLVHLLAVWLVGLLFLIGGVYLQFVLTLATIVGVLEYQTGIQALKRAVLLLNGNYTKGYLLILLLSLVYLFIGVLLHPEDSDNPVISGVILVLLVLSYTFSGVVVCSGKVVFYFSCRAHHQEHVDYDYIFIDNSLYIKDLGKDSEAGMNLTR